MLPLQKVFHPWLHIGPSNGSYLILASVKSCCLLRLVSFSSHFKLVRGHISVCCFPPRMVTCLAAPCQFRLLWKGHVKLLTNSYSHLTRIAIEIVHFTLLHLGGLHGDVRILHLQLWNCTWQPPIVTASSSFPIKAGMNARNSIGSYLALFGNARILARTNSEKRISHAWSTKWSLFAKPF